MTTPPTTPAPSGPPAGTAVRAQRQLIWVEGPDSAHFLQGLLSNEVVGLDAGAARPALLLDARGHIVAAATVHRDGPEAFTLVLEPHLGAPMADALERYHFSEDLEILGPEPAEVVVVAAVERPAMDAEMILPGAVPGTWEVAVPDPAATIAARGWREADPAVLEGARILTGVPRVGVDTGPSTLVQEAGLEDVAVSFDKGCYLGQETVARAQFRGRVNRTLRRLRLDELPAQLPAPVTHEGKDVGAVTSAVALDDGAVGLAILRRQVPPGARVGVGDPEVAAIVEEAGAATGRE